MEDRITIQGQDGAFGAYIALPMALPAPAVVVLQELFGVNVKDTVDSVANLPGCGGKVGVMGFCLGGLMTFLTAVRYGVDAAVAYHGGDTEKYLGEINGLDSPLLMHLAEEDEFISKLAQAEIKAALASKPNAKVYSYPGQRHAFARHNGAHYNAAAAALANGRTREFLHDHLQ
jgi:carboxymethylenebutenolidase